ncbi:hypothetical protein [Caproiciproducens sp. CPB-2]|uniref:hypothetical protein n=1 Tax=Caproiciproducens sp. CPB-2 TaxID=3030017 RepID=UPI0023DC9A10|nr:hypothetical protein [Caproiciproducens sp. CPB-2]MDF1494591.1 hypothetical protein [Caproiciproducens sp. CPB-2]
MANYRQEIIKHPKFPAQIGWAGSIAAAGVALSFLVIDDGRVAQRGTHDELMAQDGIYRNFVSIRQSAEGWKIT